MKTLFLILAMALPYQAFAGFEFSASSIGLDAEESKYEPTSNSDIGFKVYTRFDVFELSGTLALWPRVDAYYLTKYVDFGVGAMAINSIHEEYYVDDVRVSNMHSSKERIFSVRSKTYYDFNVEASYINTDYGDLSIITINYRVDY